MEQHKAIKLFESLNISKYFQENRIDFDEKIVIKIDEPTFSRNILKKALETELLLDVTLIAKADSTR